MLNNSPDCVQDINNVEQNQNVFGTNHIANKLGNIEREIFDARKDIEKFDGQVEAYLYRYGDGAWSQTSNPKNSNQRKKNPNDVIGLIVTIKGRYTDI